MNIKTTLRTIGVTVTIIAVAVVASVAVAWWMTMLMPEEVEGNNHNHTESYMGFSIPNMCNATYIEYELSLKTHNIDSSTYPILMPYKLRVNTTELEVGEKLYLTVTYYYSWAHCFFEELTKVEYLIIVDKISVWID